MNRYQFILHWSNEQKLILNIDISKFIGENINKLQQYSITQQNTNKQMKNLRIESIKKQREEEKSLRSYTSNLNLDSIKSSLHASPSKKALNRSKRVNSSTTTNLMDLAVYPRHLQQKDTTLKKQTQRKDKQLLRIKQIKENFTSLKTETEKRVSQASRVIYRGGNQETIPSNSKVTYIDALEQTCFKSPLSNYRAPNNFSKQSVVKKETFYLNPLKHHSSSKIPCDEKPIVSQVSGDVQTYIKKLEKDNSMKTFYIAQLRSNIKEKDDLLNDFEKQLFHLKEMLRMIGSIQTEGNAKNEEKNHANSNKKPKDPQSQRIKEGISKGKTNKSNLSKLDLTNKEVHQHKDESIQSSKGGKSQQNKMLLFNIIKEDSSECEQTISDKSDEAMQEMKVEESSFEISRSNASQCSEEGDDEGYDDGDDEGDSSTDSRIMLKAKNQIEETRKDIESLKDRINNVVVREVRINSNSKTKRDEMPNRLKKSTSSVLVGKQNVTKLSKDGTDKERKGKILKNNIQRTKSFQSIISPIHRLMNKERS